MKTVAILVGMTLRLSASAMFTVTPNEMLLKFPGDEQLEMVTDGSRLRKVKVTIHDTVTTVPEAELKDLPSVFLDSVTYEMVPSSNRRQVSFDAGDRGDPFSNPPIPAKVVHVTLCFEDGAYTGRVTETPTDATTSVVRIKDVGKPETVRATVKKQPPMSIQRDASKGK